MREQIGRSLPEEILKKTTVFSAFSGYFIGHLSYDLRYISQKLILPLGLTLPAPGVDDANHIMSQFISFNK